MLGPDFGSLFERFVGILQGLAVFRKNCRAVGLEILSLKTHFANAEKLTKIAERLPTIWYMGNEFKIVCRKAPEERKRTGGKNEPHLLGI